jgi:hypothetical protein
MIFTHNRTTIIFRKILALYCFSSLLSVANAVSDPTATLIWLKPIESDQKMKNNTIVEGSALDLMQFVANQIPEVNHQFEAYSIKRGWHLIKKSKNKNAVYCFWGADYTAEREEWGYYTKPTSVTLPFMVAARKGVLSAYDNNGSVSVKQLLKNGYSTVIFENVINAWTEAVEQAGYHGVVQISDLDKDLSDHTLLMIEKRRIDFGYISHRAIANLDVHNNHNITLYDVSELPDADGGDARLLCSKTPLGNKMVGLINKALAKIHGNTSLNHQMKLLIFKSEGYPERFKSAFERQWNKAYPIVKND